MRNKKNMVIGILCLTLVFMGIGYSLFSSTLNITGASQGSGTFDVKITNVEVDENNTTSGATNTMDPIGANYAVTETTLSATFNAPGDYITYNITVTNRGSIDAVISVETNMLDSTDSFELSCTVQEGTEVQANSYITFPCVMKFKESVDSFSNIQTAHMSVRMRSMQKATYAPPAEQSTPEACFISVRQGEINDYLISDPDCSTNVVIPDNLTLGVREVTSMEFNDAKCSQFESALLQLDDNYTCTNLKAQFNSIKSNPQAVFNSFIGQLINVTYGEEGLEKYPINKIGDGVFAGKQITEATIGEGIEIIGVAAFAYNGITSVTLSRGLTTIGTSSFTSNAIMGTLTIPNTVTTIGNGAFEGNSGTLKNQITSIVFESGSHLQTIGNWAFQHNKLSGTLTIPSSVTSIGNSAFSGKDDGTRNTLTSVVFESNSHLETIGDYAFRDNALTGTLTIPSSVTSIGDSAFYGEYDGSTNQIASLVFESNSHLQTIGSYAFYYNALTGTLTIPSSVTSIGQQAFYSNSIEELHLGAYITNIGSLAFSMRNSTDLKDVYVDMTESNWNSNVTKASSLFNGTPTMHFN